MLLNNIYRISEKTRKRWIGITKKFNIEDNTVLPWHFAKMKTVLSSMLNFFAMPIQRFRVFFANTVNIIQ